ncbi:unnamed protein product [Effrenium voratum]|uniref:C2HC/C3H-type domain-containing protein n=1 Tax=Effrenium voratum TaxID=2562239 RepID=A0AA36JE26_9DINO|nr:unnamed protein product [Effrenium voratum]CAJ1429214.1 unnamed protein product [Effrenium voratum]
MARQQQGDDTPLLASPAPHVGTTPEAPPRERGIANASLSWRNLLVNSPPAWAMSPEKTTETRIPPFPWPAQNLPVPRSPPRLGRDAARMSKFSEEEDEEIERFLNHCSFSSTASRREHLPRTPSPKKGLDDTVSSVMWTPPPKLGEDAMTASTTLAGMLGSGTRSASRARSCETETPDLTSPFTPAKPRGVMEDAEALLRPCSCCGRRFRENRLPVHEEICFRNAAKQRTVFESSRQRCEAVSGRWWSAADEARRSHTMPAQRSPARPDARASPGMRRSPSAPTYHGGRQSASPDGPSKYAGAGLGQSPPVQASSARRSRSMPQGRSKHSEGRSSAAWTFPHSAQTKSGMPRRSVSGRRSSAGSPLPSSRGSASTFPGHRPGSRPSWGTAPAMPDAQDSKGRMGDLHGPKTGSGRSDGSLLGSIIEDVAQLSAQVERLLSRRKDLLRGEEMRRSDRSAEVLELSPSDSSTGPEGDRRAW